jgi:hypothetical protein
VIPRAAKHPGLSMCVLAKGFPVLGSPG